MGNTFQEINEPILLADDINPWDRQPEETADQFLAFSAYRDSGVGAARSIRRAWRDTHPTATQINSTWFNWSKKYRWKERVTQFDLWVQKERRDAVVRAKDNESARVLENAQVHRDNECYLAEQAFRKAQEILAIPLIRDSFVEQRDGKTIVHRAQLITPAYYFAAAALMKAGSDIGRRGLGIKDNDDEDGLTPEQFRKLFYRHTGEIARDLPAGALPAPIEGGSAVKPDINLPNQQGESGESGVTKFVPPRERP
jgi:hypothetical protein